MRPGFQRVPPRYECGHWWFHGMRRIVLAFLADTSARGQALDCGRVLDLGCGPGWMVADLPAGAWGVGLDRNAPILSAIPFVLGDAGKLPFGNQNAVPRPVDRLFQQFLGLEARWLASNDLPWGLSLLCMAEA